jgi:hypothetical protein
MSCVILWSDVLDDVLDVLVVAEWSGFSRFRGRFSLVGCAVVVELGVGTAVPGVGCDVQAPPLSTSLLLLSMLLSMLSPEDARAARGDDVDANVENCCCCWCCGAVTVLVAG